MYIKLFEQFINESTETKAKISAMVPGIKLVEYGDITDQIELDGTPYTSAEGFGVEYEDIDADYGLMINVYDGKDFQFFIDSMPISTSLHSRSEKNSMARTELEIPKPLSKLNAKIFKEVLAQIE